MDDKEIGMLCGQIVHDSWRIHQQGLWHCNSDRSPDPEYKGIKVFSTQIYLRTSKWNPFAKYEQIWHKEWDPDAPQCVKEYVEETLVMFSQYCTYQRDIIRKNKERKAKKELVQEKKGREGWKQWCK